MWRVSGSVFKSARQRCAAEQLSPALYFLSSTRKESRPSARYTCWPMRPVAWSGPAIPDPLLVGEESGSWAVARRPYGGLHMEQSEIKISQHIRAALRTGGREKPSLGMLLGDALILMVTFLRMSALSAFPREKLKDVSISVILLLALLKLLSGAWIAFCRRALSFSSADWQRWYFCTPVIEKEGEASMFEHTKMVEHIKMVESSFPSLDQTSQLNKV